METTLNAPLNKAQHDILPLLAHIRTEEELAELHELVLAFSMKKEHYTPEEACELVMNDIKGIYGLQE